MILYWNFATRCYFTEKAATHRDFGENVEHKRKRGQIDADSLSPEALLHILRQSTNLYNKQQ